MSDLPSDEQLRRIERGVRRRIDRRRQIAQRLAGASVAVLLVVGGVALVRPLVVTSGGSSASGAGGTRADPSSVVPVRCHRGATTVQAEAARTGLPASALAACAAVATGIRPDTAEDGGVPSPAPTPVLCTASSGVLHVYLGVATTCAAHDLRPFTP